MKRLILASHVASSCWHPSPRTRPARSRPGARTSGSARIPNQVVFGGHLEMGNIAPQVDFVPGVDLGFGDNVTLVSVIGDFRYRIKVTGATWQPYAGAGVALHMFSWDSGVVGHSSSETLGGGELIVGADVPTKTGNRFFVEGKFALGDGPSFKALAGWCFPMH